jgi:hypothetical protein
LLGYGGFNPTSSRTPDFAAGISDEHWQGRTIAMMLRDTKAGDIGARATAETRHFESLCNNKHLPNRRYGARFRLRARIPVKPVWAASSARKVCQQPAMP